jgi:hypothetical protein
MKYGLHRVMNGIFHASHMWNCFSMKEWKKGRKRSDNKMGKCKGWKGIPKREVEEMKGKTNGRRVVRELIWCEGEGKRRRPIRIGWINERSGKRSRRNKK